MSNIVDPNKYTYFTADSGMDVTNLNEFKLVNPEQVTYMPLEHHTVDSITSFYEHTYPKLPECLHFCMARMAIGKPINRNERRAMKRYNEKERKKSILSREIPID